MHAVHFSVSGVDVSPVVPVLVAFVVSAVASMGGVSGAFLLLPFQVSVLGFTGPAVTPTNHLFNVLAAPAAIVQFAREQRMLWPLALVMLAGTLPGVIFGSLARIFLLPDPRAFKLFAGVLLLALGTRMLHALWIAKRPPRSSAHPSATSTFTFHRTRIEFTCDGLARTVSSLRIVSLTFIVGIVGGVYGVGGGAFLSPILVGLLGLPVHATAGASLFATFATSSVGIAVFALAGPLAGRPAVGPDWALGGLFGLGGLAGMYVGARLQRFVPAKLIETALAFLVTGLALSYVIGFFRP